MSHEGNVEPVFLDLTCLIEYCSAYFENQHYAERVIDRYHSDGGRIVVSSDALLHLNESMNNRNRLWNFLIDEATAYLRQEDKSKGEFIADVLNYSALQSALNFDLSRGYLPDISTLRNELEDSTLDEFRSLLDDARILGDSQREELEVVKDPERFDRGGRGNWLLQSSISQYSPSEHCTNALMDYTYWCEENHRPLIVGCIGDLHEHKKETIDAMSQIASPPPRIYSTREIVEDTGVFS